MAPDLRVKESHLRGWMKGDTAPDRWFVVDLSGEEIGPLELSTASRKFAGQLIEIRHERWSEARCWDVPELESVSDDWQPALAMRSPDGKSPGLRAESLIGVTVLGTGGMALGLSEGGIAGGILAAVGVLIAVTIILATTR